MVDDIVGAFTVFFLVAWLARSAHDLADPRARSVPRRERPVPVRAPFGWWPLPIAAVVLPFLPAVVNLAHGLPFWVGPRRAIESAFRYSTDSSHALLWLCFDVLVGVGALGVLVLVAVRWRTRRSVRATAGTLVLTAAAGAVAASITPIAPNRTNPFDSGSTTLGLSEDAIEPMFEDSRIYPDWMFVSEVENGEISFGISPLWYSAAFVASAFILMFLYGRPARRSPYRAVAAVVASFVALCLLPAADHARGPFTSRSDCEPPESRWGENVEPRPMTGEMAFVCEARTSTASLFSPSTPDLALLAYGRRLCGVYTRDDPGEVARVRENSGIDVRTMGHVLADVCPPVAAVIKAQSDEREREAREYEAEERHRCEGAPRHRPLIRPESVSVAKKPFWSEYGTLGAAEGSGDGGGHFEDVYRLAEKNELVATAPGYLMILTDLDYGTCVTTESYTRRPPVETRGWHHVVEVGYRSPTGEIRIGGSRFRNLAVRGKGDYRIRVHHGWLTGEGEKSGAKRLLIMVYPGRGDDVIVHRGRTER
jgi:hypothetical protein